MVRTPINLVRGIIRLGLIKDLNLAITGMAELRSLIRPSLISPQTKLIGVPTIRLPAVIMLKIPLNHFLSHTCLHKLYMYTCVMKLTHAFILLYSYSLWL